MSTHLEEEAPENSDVPLVALLVGPDGSSPIDPDVVSSIEMTIRDVTSGTIIEDALEVVSSLGSVVDLGGEIGEVNFQFDLTPEHVKAIEGSGEKQLRLVTFKITHSGGKVRNQEITFYVDAMQDVEDLP